MPEKPRNDVGLLCFLLEIHDAFEVDAIFGLVSCSSEGDIDVLPSYPLIEVVFNLRIKN
jgi:hypothetical protein